MYTMMLPLRHFLACYASIISLLSIGAFNTNQSLYRPIGRCITSPTPTLHAPIVFTQLATSNDKSIDNDNSLLESLRSMRVKELKSELEILQISTSDVFEKEELVQRLYNARTAKVSANSSGNGNVDEKKRTKKKKKRRTYDNEDDDNNINIEGVVESSVDDVSSTMREVIDSPTVTSNSNNNNNGWTIITPFIYHELESSKSVPAQNSNNIYIRPSPGKYAAIKLQMKKDGQSKSVEWTLLVDTACSGLVLSPSAVTRANTIIPGIIQTIDNAGTMTMAGSTQTNSVAKWDSYTKLFVNGVEINHANVAACQDIGALPSGLDGILGLSFLNQFACVDFDFENDELRLEKTNSNVMIPNVNDVVAQGSLSKTMLQIYTADVTLDGRGPVKLLVDSGAASSFLNWNGVSQMKLSSSSPQIEALREQIGAMGADNMAIRLTHRYTLKRRYNLVADNNAVGDFCPGIGLGENQVCNVDIGDLPVLEALKGDGVGGILGADLLMMCDVVRFTGLNGQSPNMILMKKESS